MTKLTYKIRQTAINGHKLVLDIHHGKINITTTFFDHGDITHYVKSGRYELFLFDKYSNILISFYIKMNEVTGTQFIKEITLR